jgi:hypothetical protein
MADPTEKLLNIGILAALAAAAILAYKFLAGTTGIGSTPKCPEGQTWRGDCEGLAGMPGLLCSLGGWVAGGQGQCIPSDEVPPVVPLPKDEHGCIIGVQHYCEAPDRKCRDIAQSCTPATGSPGECYEWSVLEGKWVYSPSLPGCGIITCPDGSQHYKENCPTDKPRCDISECTPGEQVCVDGIPKICIPLGIGCEQSGFWANGGVACKPASLLKQCPSGSWVDLNNPPGITLAQACAGSEKKIITNEHYDDCIRRVMDAFKGAYGSPEGQAAAIACETDTSRNALATRTELKAFISTCEASGKKVMGWSGSIVTPYKGTFNDPYEWARAFGHEITGSLTKGYEGNPDTFPGSETVYCYKQNPGW